MAYEYNAGETVGESFARASREQLDRAVQELSEKLAADPVPAIHAARKAIKKQRALLRMVRGSLSRGARRRANATLRGAAGRLSGARDADVLIQTLDELAERFSGQLPEATFSAVREQLARERDSSQPAAAVVDEALHDLHSVLEAAEDWRLRKDGWRAIGPGVARTYRDGRRAFQQAQSKPTVEARHEFRKRVKDLWYELRLLAPICGPVVRGHAEEAGRLAELLGAEHDLGLFKDRLKGLAPEVAADVDPLMALIDFRSDQLRNESGFIARRLYADKAPAFARRTRRCWEAGQGEYRASTEQQPAALAAATRVPS